MEVMTVGILGIAAVLLATQLKSVRSEYGTYLILAAGILIAFYTVSRWGTVLQMLKQCTEWLPVDRVYVSTLLKMIGIAYTIQLCAGLCKDAGYSAIAGQIETFGKLTILSLSLPVVLALLDTVHVFLQEGL
ncbi:MAG: stage III sporulation protein AD [Lachnospiraceae bacterium]|nr:stage III sporulation protein AD [Lachnospiraceae bacterium]